MPVAFRNDCVQVEMRYQVLGELCENTLWFATVNGNATSTEGIEQLCEDLFDWWDIALQPLQSTQTILREIYGRQALQDSAQEFTRTPTGTDAGGNGGNPLPNNVSLVVSFRTGMSGRARRGRNYSLGMVESQKDGNIAVSAYVESLVAAYNQLPTALEVNNVFRHVIFSQYLGVNSETGKPEPRETPLVSTVTGYVVTDNRLDSMRTRLAGRGT